MFFITFGPLAVRLITVIARGAHCSTRCPVILTFSLRIVIIIIKCFLQTNSKQSYRPFFVRENNNVIALVRYYNIIQGTRITKFRTMYNNNYVTTRRYRKYSNCFVIDFISTGNTIVYECNVSMNLRWQWWRWYGRRTFPSLEKYMILFVNECKTFNGSRGSKRVLIKLRELG